MKVLVMIVHNNSQTDLADLLRSHKQVQEFTFTHVEGHGLQEAHDTLLSVRDRVVGYTPRVRVDILIDHNHIEAVLKSVRSMSKSGAELGTYWVTDVIHSGRL